MNIYYPSSKVAKLYASALILGLCNSAYAQTGIGTITPATSSVLEISSVNKGVLLPRVALSSIDDLATILSPANALTVFNTATAGLVPSNVSQGYYYYSLAANKWIRLFEAANGSLNIYTTDGTLTGNRIVMQGTRTLAFNGTASNAFSVDNTTFSIDAANARVGVGTLTPEAKLEIASGTTNTSGLKFSNFNAATPAGTGQTIGIDAAGNVITLANQTTPNAITTESDSRTGATFDVNDLGYTTVSNTPQTIVIPAGGKAVFINFMLGIDYTTWPTGTGDGNYEARLFMDNVASNVFLIATESTSGGAQTQFSFACVKFLTAGSHNLDVRMIRTANNGTTAGGNMTCLPLSVSFNATFLN